MSTIGVGWDDLRLNLLQQSVATNQSARCDLPNSDHLIECTQEETFRHISWTIRDLINHSDKCPRSQI